MLVHHLYYNLIYIVAQNKSLSFSDWNITMAITLYWVAKFSLIKQFTIWFVGYFNYTLCLVRNHHVPCRLRKLNTLISDQYACPSSTLSCSSVYARSKSTSYKWAWVSLLVMKIIFLLKGRVSQFPACLQIKYICSLLISVIALKSTLACSSVIKR